MTRRNMAEQVFQDAINTIRESQSELEKTISGYTGGILNKPLVDVLEDDNNLIVRADLPGFQKENISIDMGDYTLEIVALYQEDPLEDGSSYIKKERKYDEIKRVIELPEKIKADLAQATFNNGVLQIILPKLDKTIVDVE
ncbi:MAG: Hsp20/alpha crystallin family protein [Methanobacterium sp.]|nr:Hsp20/alpha crystallin family protein [Methanobacterium sp.]